MRTGLKHQKLICPAVTLLSFGISFMAKGSSLSVAANDPVNPIPQTSSQNQDYLQRENYLSGWNDLRVAARFGQDRVWKLGTDYYNAAGIDVSYVRRNVGTELVRMEVGATGSVLGSPNDMKAYNFHGQFFPALEIGPLVIGPRGLIGGSADSVSDDLVFDAGGEGRIGVEMGRGSLFLSGGRTQELTRFSLDLGATF